MPQKTPRIKHRAEVVMTDSKGRVYQQPYGRGDVQEFTDTYGRNVFMHIPVGKKIGETETYTIEVTYLGEKQYKQTYQQRVKALARAQKRQEKREEERKRLELERQEKELIQRRERIMNQIELAFASGVTSKPANEGHLKTGQRKVARNAKCCSRSLLPNQV